MCNLTLSHVVNQHLQKDLEFTDVQVNSLISAMAGQVNYHHARAQHWLYPGQGAPCTNPDGLAQPFQAKQVQVYYRNIYEDDLVN